MSAERSAPLHPSQTSLLQDNAESASPSPPPPNSGGPRRGFLRRGTKEVEAELFSAYWSSFLGYEYRNELYVGAWMGENVDLMKVFANVDRAVRKAEEILAE